MKVLRNIKKQNGLTLLELLVVVVIIGIIAAIAIPSIGNIIDNVRRDAHVANATQVIKAAMMANASGDDPPNIWHGAPMYMLEDLERYGFMEEELRNPRVISGYGDEIYSLTESIVIIDNNVYKVNLSMGNGNYMFERPLAMSEMDRSEVLPKSQ